MLCPSTQTKVAIYVFARAWIFHCSPPINRDISFAGFYVDIHYWSTQHSLFVIPVIKYLGKINCPRDNFQFSTITAFLSSNVSYFCSFFNIVSYINIILYRYCFASCLEFFIEYFSIQIVCSEWNILSRINNIFQLSSNEYKLLIVKKIQVDSVQCVTLNANWCGRN